jgi:precorrin-6Y C5,15-methyltransferase (decarboxylating)
VVSAHGRDPAEALAVVRSQPKVAVLTDERCGPAEVGAALAGRTDRRLLVGERLGLPGERVVELSPDEAAAGTWADPNVVLVLPSAELAPGPRVTVAGHRGPAGWALPVQAFAHRDSMITKAEVAGARARPPRSAPRRRRVGRRRRQRLGRRRVRALRRRRPRRRAGLLRPRARERRGPRRARARRAGPRPEALDGLPDPTPRSSAAAAPASSPRWPPAGPGGWSSRSPRWSGSQPTLAALSAYDTDAVLLQAQRLVPLAGAHRLAPTNPVFVVSGVLR